METEFRSLEPYGFPGWFVSRDGTVVSRRRKEKRLRPTKTLPVTPNAAWMVVRTNGLKPKVRVRVAELVLLAFSGPPPEDANNVIIYRDGDVNNYHIDNLEWGIRFKEKRESLWVGLTPQEKDNLRLHAKSRNQSVGRLVTAIVREWLRCHEI